MQRLPTEVLLDIYKDCSDSSYSIVALASTCKRTLFVYRSIERDTLNNALQARTQVYRRSLYVEALILGSPYGDDDDHLYVSATDIKIEADALLETTLHFKEQFGHSFSVEHPKPTVGQLRRALMAHRQVVQLVKFAARMSSIDDKHAFQGLIGWLPAKYLHRQLYPWIRGIGNPSKPEFEFTMHKWAVACYECMLRSIVDEPKPSLFSACKAEKGWSFQNLHAFLNHAGDKPLLRVALLEIFLGAELASAIDEFRQSIEETLYGLERQRNIMGTPSAASTAMAIRPSSIIATPLTEIYTDKEFQYTIHTHLLYGLRELLRNHDHGRECQDIEITVQDRIQLEECDNRRWRSAITFALLDRSNRREKEAFLLRWINEAYSPDIAWAFHRDKAARYLKDPDPHSKTSNLDPIYRNYVDKPFRLNSSQGNLEGSGNNL